LEGELKLFVVGQATNNGEEKQDLVELNPTTYANIPQTIIQ